MRVGGGNCRGAKSKTKAGSGEAMIEDEWAECTWGTTRLGGKTDARSYGWAVGVDDHYREQENASKTIPQSQLQSKERKERPP